MRRTEPVSLACVRQFEFPYSSVHVLYFVVLGSFFSTDGIHASTQPNNGRWSPSLAFSLLRNTLTQRNERIMFSNKFVTNVIGNSSSSRIIVGGGRAAASAAVGAAAAAAAVLAFMTNPTSNVGDQSTSAMASTTTNCEPRVKYKLSRLHRKRTTLQEATTTTSGILPPSSSTSNKALRRKNTKEELALIRIYESEMLTRWERDEDGWRELPARAWPAYQPTPKQMKQIEKDASVKGCDKNKTTTKGGDNNNRDLCKELQFQIATTLVFYMIDAEKGLQQFESLAKSGHVDSMVACGIILLEGIGGIPIDSKKGMEWLEKAVATSSSSSPQAIYELGTVYYTGIDGIVDENPKKAYELFCEAAKLQHVAGMYMCADCLVEGEGCKMDVAKAVPLFYQAAELGHRYSRQKIRELLNKQEYKQQEQDGR